MTTPHLLLAWLATFGADNVWRVGPQAPIWAPRLLYLVPWAVLAAILWQMASERRHKVAWRLIGLVAAVGAIGAFLEARGGLGAYSVATGALQAGAMVATALLFAAAPDRYRCGVAGGLFATHLSTVVAFVASRSVLMAPALGESRLAMIYGERSDVGEGAACVIMMAVGVLWGMQKESDGWQK